MWDLGGQQNLRSIWEKYYLESHGLVYVVDGFDASRLEESRIVLGRALKNTYLGSRVPVLILVNKDDLGQVFWYFILWL